MTRVSVSVSPLRAHGSCGILSPTCPLSPPITVAFPNKLQSRVSRSRSAEPVIRGMLPKPAIPPELQAQLDAFACQLAGFFPVEPNDAFSKDESVEVSSASETAKLDEHSQRNGMNGAYPMFGFSDTERCAAAIEEPRKNLPPETIDAANLLNEVKEAVAEVLHSGVLSRIKTAIQKASQLLESGAVSAAEGTVDENAVHLAELLMHDIEHLTSGKLDTMISAKLETTQSELEDPAETPILQSELADPVLSNTGECWITFADSRTPSDASPEIAPVSPIFTPCFAPTLFTQVPQPTGSLSEHSNSPPITTGLQPRLQNFASAELGTTSLGGCKVDTQAACPQDSGLSVDTALPRARAQFPLDTASSESLSATSMLVPERRLQSSPPEHPGDHFAPLPSIRQYGRKIIPNQSFVADRSLPRMDNRALLAAMDSTCSIETVLAHPGESPIYCSVVRDADTEILEVACKTPVYRPPSALVFCQTGAVSPVPQKPLLHPCNPPSAALPRQLSHVGPEWRAEHALPAQLRDLSSFATRLPGSLMLTPPIENGGPCVVFSAPPAPVYDIGQEKCDLSARSTTLRRAPSSPTLRPSFACVARSLPLNGHVGSKSTSALPARDAQPVAGRVSSARRAPAPALSDVVTTCATTGYCATSMFSSQQPTGAKASPPPSDVSFGWVTTDYGSLSQYFAQHPTSSEMSPPPGDLAPTWHAAGYAATPQLVAQEPARPGAAHLPRDVAPTRCAISYRETSPFVAQRPARPETSLPPRDAAPTRGAAGHGATPPLVSRQPKHPETSRLPSDLLPTRFTTSNRAPSPFVTQQPSRSKTSYSPIDTAPPWSTTGRVAVSSFISQQPPLSKISHPPSDVVPTWVTAAHGVTSPRYPRHGATSTVIAPYTSTTVPRPAPETSEPCDGQMPHGFPGIYVRHAEFGGSTQLNVGHLGGFPARAPVIAPCPIPSIAFKPLNWIKPFQVTRSTTPGYAPYRSAVQQRTVRACV